MESKNRAGMIENLRSAVAVAVSVTLFALIICTYLLTGDLFDQLIPLWLGVAFCAICFLLERIPLTRDHMRLKISLQVICVVLAGVLLKVC